MAAAGCGEKRSGRVFGWGLPVLILGTLLGIFSTALNGLQTLNGLFCFVRVQSESSLVESLVSSFVVSGYKHNHLYSIQFACNNPTEFLMNELYPFCTRRTWTDISGTTSWGFLCRQKVYGKGKIESYSYSLSLNCSSEQISNQSFMVSLTPGSLSMTGASNVSAYNIVAFARVNTCAFDRYFYFVFTMLCVAITVTIFIIRACMRTCLVGLSFRLSHSETFYWVYKDLEKYGFFNFENPYRNEPYHLVKGEKYYVMKDRSSCISGDYVGDTTDTDTLAYSSANSVYKFTYVNGEVFAYCKDGCGFEKFTAANVQRSIAAVIKEYLKQKSRSACVIVTNDEKAHFLSLSECCELAQDGYELVEETSDRTYRIFYRSLGTQSRAQSRRSAQPHYLFHRERSSSL